MLYFIVVTSFISILLMIYFLLLLINGKTMEMAERVSTIENLDKAWMKHREVVGESIVSVLYKSIGGTLIKFTPSYKSNKQKNLLEKSGILRDTTAESFVARRALITISSVALTIMLLMYLMNDIVYALLFAGLTILIVNVSYKFYLSKKISTRGENILKSLPFTLDLITVSVEAGLSLDGAIGRIVTAVDGPLSDEFSKTLKEMRMGIEKKVALKNMSNRVGIKDVSMILSSLIQADELGISLGKILRIEGTQLREKRKQAAREKAMKAPVKMLFPLMIFIFPVIFVIILGPAGISMMASF